MQSVVPGDAAHALARQACRDIEQALLLGTDAHASVHAARKAIRRLRALLALLDGTELALEDADAVLRRLGDGLSGLRDAHVAVETAALLAATAPTAPWPCVIGQLQARRDAWLRRALAGDPAFGRRRDRLQRVGTLLDSQPWATIRRAQVRVGLDRSLARAGKAERRAHRNPSPERLHRWRRKVRRLRMQLEAAPHLDPRLAKAHTARGGGGDAKALHRLSNHLGWQQDLRMLRNLVRVMPGVVDRRQLLAQIDLARTAPVD
jgi:CHAD domain-containing protein